MSSPTHTGTEPDFLVEFAAVAERFAVAVATADPRAHVPSCPGWTVHDLVVHLGNVHAWAATVVETGRAAPEQDDEPTSRRAKVLAQWYAGKAGDLFQVLRGCDADAPCWNFAFGEGRAGFWRRRQLHETTMHAWDLALATGRAPEVSPAVATDGVDEALRVFLYRMHQRGHPADLRAPLTIRTADTGRAWTLRPARRSGDPPGHPAGPPQVTEGEEPGADLVAGPATSVYGLLWKRCPATDPTLTLTGDGDRLRRFLSSRLTA